jgi:hypothetical protein
MATVKVDNSDGAAVKVDNNDGKEIITFRYLPRGKVTDQHVSSILGTNNREQMDKLKSRITYIKKDLSEFVTPYISKMLLTHAISQNMLVGGTDRLVQNMKEIGTAFQLDHSHEEGMKCFSTLHGQFEQNPSWTIELEKTYMEMRNLCYDDDLNALNVARRANTNAKGPPLRSSIVHTISKRKVEMVRVIRKRMSKYHGYHISTRTPDGEVYRRRRPKGSFSDKFLVRKEGSFEKVKVEDCGSDKKGIAEGEECVGEEQDMDEGQIPQDDIAAILTTNDNPSVDGNGAAISDNLIADKPAAINYKMECTYLRKSLKEQSALTARKLKVLEEEKVAIVKKTTKTTKVGKKVSIVSIMTVFPTYILT